MKSFTVLLAEDQDDDALLMQRAFERTGHPHALQRVRDGEELIAYLSGAKKFSDRKSYPLPALVLLDLKMPRKNGFEVLQWIRDQHDFKRLLTIVFTSSRHECDINRAYDLGANSYVAKPVNFHDLVEFVAMMERYWIQICHAPEVRNRPA